MDGYNKKPGPVAQVPTDSQSAAVTLKWSKIYAADFHTCALSLGANKAVLSADFPMSAWCWGYNLGQLGIGSQDSRSVPTPVSGGIAFASLALGDYHGLGISTNGTLYGWGECRAERRTQRRWCGGSQCSLCQALHCSTAALSRTPCLLGKEEPAAQGCACCMLLLGHALPGLMPAPLPPPCLRHWATLRRHEQQRAAGCAALRD